MELQETIKAFKAHLAKMDAYSHAMGVMSYDENTVMPKNAAEGYGAAMGVLSEESYKLLVNDDLKEMIKVLLQHKDELDDVTAAEAKRLDEDLTKMSRIPMDEFVDFQVLVSQASGVWKEAKLTNDYAKFEPYLEKIVAANRRFAGYYNPNVAPYDALLNEFERGLTTAQLDEYFKNVRAKLVPLIKEIGERGIKIRTDFAERCYPVAKQRELSDYIMSVMTINRDDCAIGETEHPFTTNFNKHDVRITTHYHEDMVLSSFYSVVHEGGHALYELHTDDKLMMSPLGTGVSMGVHESQSRFYENIIGRSEEFITYIFPKLKELFPEQLADVTAHEFFLAANKSEPSLIRTEADELTYSLHIMVRYEIERKLIEGTITTKELPAEWNRLYKEYLGVDVPTDTEGVLQDSHWSGGALGYFPSYSIGSAYSAQMLDVMEHDFDVWGEVRKGNLAPIVEWLTERVYKFGSMKEPKEIVEIACGAPFDPNYYTNYIEKKFRKIYQLD